MKRAFTLVELVLVLLVLALLAHAATASLGRVRERKMREAADRQLEAVRDSVWCERAGADPTGFLADMGRMPMLKGTGTGGTLEELWKRPDGVPEFALREATGTNLCAGVAGTKGVYVPTGWRGPYLRLPTGRDELLDPWGNRVAAEDDAGLERLSVSNGFVVAVSHYGVSGQARERISVPLVPDGGGASRLVVNFVSAGGATAESGKCAWYGPASGMVTGAVGIASCGGMTVFEGLTPGVRTIWYSIGGAEGKSFVNVRPGDNALKVVLP